MAYTGTLVRFVASNGFGFIKRDDGEGIAFCHFSQVMNGGSNEMVVGSKMIFDLGVSFRSGRSRARNIIITEHHHHHSELNHHTVEISGGAPRRARH